MADPEITESDASGQGLAKQQLNKICCMFAETRECDEAAWRMAPNIVERYLTMLDEVVLSAQQDCTPGPWELGALYEIGDGRTLVRDIYSRAPELDEADRIIGRVVIGTVDWCDPKREANARLLVAALGAITAQGIETATADETPKAAQPEG